MRLFSSLVLGRIGPFTVTHWGSLVIARFICGDCFGRVFQRGGVGVGSADDHWHAFAFAGGVGAGGERGECRGPDTGVVRPGLLTLFPVVVISVLFSAVFVLGTVLSVAAISGSSRQVFRARYTVICTIPGGAGFSWVLVPSETQVLCLYKVYGLRLLQQGPSFDRGIIGGCDGGA